MSELKHKLTLAEKLVGRGVSRRDFMQLAIAAGLTVAAADALFVKAVRAQPRQGGVARFGLAHGATTDNLDPGSWPDTFTQTAFWGSGCNSLTVVTHTGDIAPDLAESFEPAEGAKKWVFKLRRGTTFHDGKPVTPEDVVASFRHHMGDDSGSAAKSLLESVTDIQGDGPETVIFTLKEANADFPYIASDYHIPILPSKDGAADWQSGNWTGPFSLEEFQPGVNARLKRNPNYFHEGKPYFDEVEFIAIPDTAARINALMTGDVQFIGRPDLKTLTMLERSPGVKIIEQTGYAHYVIPMHTTVAPFDNVDVRLALKYAIDRQDIVNKVFLGHGTPGNDNPIPPQGVKFAINPEPVHSYDPERAKSHLQKAGLSSLSVDLSTSDAAFAGAVDAATLYKEHAAAAGIDINVVREPADAYWDNVWLKKPFCFSYWSGRPTADWMFATAYAADAAWNDSKWNHPRFNELMVSARAETDEETRAAMYAEMQQILHTEGGVIVMVFNNILHAHSDKLAYGDLAANWENDGLKVAERWWFAA